LRLFIALDLSEEQKSHLTLLQDELKPSLNNVKWVDVYALHITLKFLGEVETIPHETLFSLLHQAVKTFRPFDFNLKKLGVFPNKKRPRVIWAGVEKGNEKIIELSKSINQKLKNKGFEEEKKEFMPHVTLGRIKNFNRNDPLNQILDNYKDFSTPASKATHINLYQSILSPKGATYVSLQKFKFCAGENSM